MRLRTGEVTAVVVVLAFIVGAIWFRHTPTDLVGVLGLVVLPTTVVAAGFLWDVIQDSRQPGRYDDNRS